MVVFILRPAETQTNKHVGAAECVHTLRSCQNFVCVVCTYGNAVRECARADLILRSSASSDVNSSPSPVSPCKFGRVFSVRAKHTKTKKATVAVYIFVCCGEHSSSSSIPFPLELEYKCSLSLGWVKAVLGIVGHAILPSISIIEMVLC